MTWRSGAARWGILDTVESDSQQLIFAEPLLEQVLDCFKCRVSILALDLDPELGSDSGTEGY